MTFEHEGRTYAFNQIFDGWRLALACAVSLASGQQVDVLLESGEKLKLRHNDVVRIEAQLRRGNGSAAA